MKPDEPVLRELGYLYGYYTKPAMDMTREEARAKFGAPQHMIVEVIYREGSAYIGDMLASCPTFEAAKAAGRILAKQFPEVP